MKRVLPLLLLCACGPEYDEHPELVSRLRALAIKVEPPEASPGDTVTLTALVADPLARAVSRQWVACPTFATLEAPADPRACVSQNRVLLGAGESATFEIPDLALAEGDWVDLYVALEVSAGSERDVASKTIRVTTSTAPNANPSLTEIRVDGAVLGTAGEIQWGVSHDLEVRGTGEPQDSLEGQLFVSAGRFDAFGGNRGLLPYSVLWLLDGDVPARGFVWALVRDGRGGVDFAEREVSFSN